MFFCSDMVSINTNLIQVNVSFLGVVITVIALIPTLLELIRIKSPSFMSSETARHKLNGRILALGKTVWVFGSATFMSLIGLIYPNCILVAIDFVLTVIGVLIITKVSYDVSMIARSVI